MFGISFHERLEETTASKAYSNLSSFKFVNFFIINFFFLLIINETNIPTFQRLIQEKILKLSANSIKLHFWLKKISNHWKYLIFLCIYWVEKGGGHGNDLFREGGFGKRKKGGSKVH